MEELLVRKMVVLCHRTCSQMVLSILWQILVRNSLGNSLENKWERWKQGCQHFLFWLILRGMYLFLVDLWSMQDPRTWVQCIIWWQQIKNLEQQHIQIYWGFSRTSSVNWEAKIPATASESMWFFFFYITSALRKLSVCWKFRRSMQKLNWYV